MLMAQNFLYRFDHHTVLQQKCSRSKPQLMGRILRRIKPGCTQMLFDQSVDTGAADALVAGGEEQGVFIPPDDRPTDRKIGFQR